MPEPSFLGLSKSHWDLFNGFANWFAAIGSFAAAVVALYIANRSSKPTARVMVGHRIIIGPGSTKPYPEFAVFRIVNTGDRPIRVIQLGWRVGLFRKRFAVQMYEASQSSPLPVELSHGQEAQWFIPLSATEGQWPDYFSERMLMPYYRTAIWTLRAQVFSSVGYIFESRPEEGLLKRLRGACEKLSKHES